MSDRSLLFEEPKTDYSTVAKIIHWLLAILLITLIILGWYMTSIPNRPDSGWYFNLHKSLGIIAGLLIGFRILWRVTHQPPLLPRTIAIWHSHASNWVHRLLYVCMIIMPLTGFFGAYFGKHGVAIFGFPIPILVKPNHALSENLFTVHVYVSWILVALISLHILAALKHLLIERDFVFRRMWF